MAGLHFSAPVMEACLNIEMCLKFETKTTLTVNQEAKDPWIFVVFFILAVVVNSISAAIIGRQEKTGINTMIICDCLLNVISMAGMAAYALNISSWGSSQLCTIALFFRVVLVAWNNLVPVAIATQRYLLVCRAKSDVRCKNCLLAKLMIDMKRKAPKK